MLHCQNFNMAERRIIHASSQAIESREVEKQRPRYARRPFRGGQEMLNNLSTNDGALRVRAASGH